MTFLLFKNIPAKQKDKHDTTAAPEEVVVNNARSSSLVPGDGPRSVYRALECIWIRWIKVESITVEVVDAFCLTVGNGV